MVMRGLVLGIILICTTVPVMGMDCWRGEPSPQCRSFLITEFGITRRLDGVSKNIRDEELHSFGIRYEVGPMFNVGEKYALGGTVTLRETGESSYGLNGRFRYWMSRNWSLDLSPGILFYSTSGEDDYELLYPALTARFSLNYADFIGISGGVEQIRVKNEGSELDWYLGVHAGSYPGAALGLIFVVLSLLAVSSSGITGMH